MKKCIKIAIIASTIYFSTILPANASEETLDSVVAIVNNGVIVESELDRAMEKSQNQLSLANTSKPEKEAFKKQVLSQMINKKLQIQLADMVGINVSDEQVDKAISSIAEKNKLSTDQLYAELSRQGLSRTEYRETIHDELLIHQVQEQAVVPSVNVSLQEVDEFMRSKAWLAHNNKEYHLEDILVAIPDTPTSKDIQAAKQKASEVYDEIKKGADFNKVALKESEGSSALQGGDLGWRKLPEIPSAFADQILLVKEKEIAGPIQTANGFHIIKVAGIRSTGKELSLDDQKKQIQQLIFERKFKENLQSWMTKIRGEAFIDLEPKKKLA